MNRPTILKLTFSLVLVLAIVVSGFAAARQFGLISTTGRGLPMSPSGLEGGPRQRGLNPNFQPGDFENQPFPGDRSGLQERTPGGPGMALPEGMSTPFQTFVIMAIANQYSSWFSLGLGVLGMLAAFLIWKPSPWGAALGVILSLLVIAKNIPAFFLGRLPFAAMTQASNALPAILEIGLSLLLLVMLLLPATRRAIKGAITSVPKERVVL